MNCFKWLACCGFSCSVISSVGDICKGAKTIKEEIEVKIENHFQPKKIYYLHREGNKYFDLKENEEVELIFFDNKQIDKSSSL